MSVPGATLVVFSGLPGVGKSTIARLLSARLRAAYLRVDTIEQAIRSGGVGEVGAAGYEVANRLAVENLRLGRHVVADCVNPVAASREGWRKTASEAAARLAEIRVTCSDETEHRRRLDKRNDDVPGLTRVTWDRVMNALAEPWDGAPHLLLDTALMSAEAAVERCVRCVMDRAEDGASEVRHAGGR